MSTTSLRTNWWKKPKNNQTRKSFETNEANDSGLGKEVENSDDVHRFLSKRSLLLLANPRPLQPPPDSSPLTRAKPKQRANRRLTYNHRLHPSPPPQTPLPRTKLRQELLAGTKHTSMRKKGARRLDLEKRTRKRSVVGSLNTTTRRASLPAVPNKPHCCEKPNSIHYPVHATTHKPPLMGTNRWTTTERSHIFGLSRVYRNADAGDSSSRSPRHTPPRSSRNHSPHKRLLEVVERNGSPDRSFNWRTNQRKRLMPHASLSRASAQNYWKTSLPYHTGDSLSKKVHRRKRRNTGGLCKQRKEENRGVSPATARSADQRRGSRSEETFFAAGFLENLKTREMKIRVVVYFVLVCFPSQNYYIVCE